MSAGDDPLANLKALHELRELLEANPTEAEAAVARVRMRIERAREGVLHKRRCEVQDRLIAIEHSKGRALKWLVTGARKDRPPRTDRDARSMAACGHMRLKRVRPRDRKREIEELHSIDALAVHLDLRAREWLRRHGPPKDWTPTAERLKQDRREQITRTDDATARPAFLIGRELAAVLESRIDAPRRSEEWCDIAVLILTAMAHLDSEALGVSDLLSWGVGEFDYAEVFRDPQGIRALVRSHLADRDLESAIRLLNDLTLAAVMNLRATFSRVGRDIPGHIERVRAEKAQEVERRTWRENVAYLRALALKCNRHNFPYSFQPWIDGEDVPKWRARCNWKEYPRSWIQDAIRPFLRELSLRAGWIGVEPQDLFSYTPTNSENDEGQIRAAHMAEFTSKLYASLDDTKRQVELEEDLVDAFAEDSAWSERYHDIFEVIEHRLATQKWRSESVLQRSRDSDAEPTAGTSTYPQHNDELPGPLNIYAADGSKNNPLAVPIPAVLRRDGNDWLIGYGGEQKPMAHRIGLLYIQYLVSKVNQPVASVELFGLRVSGSDRVGLDAVEEIELDERDSAEEGADEVTDDDGVRQYEARIRSASAEIEDLKEIGADEEKQARLQEEIDQILAELGRSTGLRGRRRKLNDPDRRQRKSVGQEITRAIEAIGQQWPDLGAHLNDAIRGPSSEAPEYRPRVMVSWDLG